MNKSTVLILYSSHNAGPDVPFSSPKYQACYEALYTLGDTMGLHLCRAPLDWYSPETNQFEKTWEFVDQSWRLSGPVKPDLILDRTRARTSDSPLRKLIIERFLFIDDPAFTRFANNKYETSQQLPQFFKPYRKISSADELATFLSESDQARVVIKPENGSGGDGVHIVLKEEALGLPLEFPVIAQEFIDSSSGIPGITSTYHDLRLVFIGDELVYSYIRTPAEGSLLANLAQGGSMHIIDITALPHSLEPIIRETQRLFSSFPQKTYTIDVMFDRDQRPWIIEYNTMPGMFFPPEEKAIMLRAYKRLLEELQRAITSRQS
ncbi:MAG: RimK family alpha-L-glutamate ligase [Undibacterium sp.]